jgi:hypothetical protein
MDDSLFSQSKVHIIILCMMSPRHIIDSPFPFLDNGIDEDDGVGA